MRFRDFVRANRKEIDRKIRAMLKDPEFKLTDEERRLWVLNDEGLYRLARKAGVKI